jgi:hypothetical protein
VATRASRKVLKDLVATVKAGRVADGLLAAIDSCGTLLKSHYQDLADRPDRHGTRQAAADSLAERGGFEATRAPLEKMGAISPEFVALFRSKRDIRAAEIYSPRIRLFLGVYEQGARLNIMITWLFIQRLINPHNLSSYG